MSGVFGFSREAVRVKVKKCEGTLQPEFRKFSVDPQITSFEVLQSILAKAFDLKSEFAISYKVYDVYGHETFMPLLSDWDLDAAFLKAHNISLTNNSEPCLCLQVDLKPFEECSDDWEIKTNVPLITQFRTGNAQEAKPSPRLHGIINQMGKTFNMVQRALNIGEDGNTAFHPPRPPLSDSEFRKYLDPVGQIIQAKELRWTIYFGGIDPSLRKVVWKHILNVYPDGMSGRERMDYIKKKASEYIALRETWKMAVARGPVVGELAYTTGMVKKDVLRTDRQHKFYAGSDDNQNIASLFNILTTYALNHPKVSYCQGMSDLASPLLVTMGDEAHAYICFCALMARLCTNFMLDGIAMTQKFTHLAEGLLYYDSEFYAYLKSHQADDLLFCYRWLLLEMKREFAFDDSLRMLEVLWSSLPAGPPDKELKLYDVKFQPAPLSTPPISPLVKTPRENPYTKVCALRRQSSSMSLVNYSAKKISSVKRQNHSLDESLGRCKNNIIEIRAKHQSLDDTSLIQHKTNSNNDHISVHISKLCDSQNSSELSSRLKSPKSPKFDDLRPRSVSPLEQKSDSVILNNQMNSHKLLAKSKSTSLSSSMTSLIKNSKRTGHFKELKERIAAGKLGIFSSLDRLDGTHSIKEENEHKPKGKVVRNLNEFFHLASVNKNKVSTKIMRVGSVGDGENPKIFLTKSSFDDSESSSNEHNSSSLEKVRHLSSTSNSCDDTLDECSPDESQNYDQLTTSITRELWLELENLDRQVFERKINEKNESSDASCSECSSKLKRKCDCIVSKQSSEIMDTDTVTEVAEIETVPKLDLKLGNKKIIKRVNRTNQVFIWENPLHQTSPNLLNVKNVSSSVQTPDEQADLEFDSEPQNCVMNVETPVKTADTEIKDNFKKETNHKVACGSEKFDGGGDKRRGSNDENIPDILKLDPVKADLINIDKVALTNSCEEVMEIKAPNILPPPNEFGGGNPFLMFLCLTVLLQHREQVIGNGMDYNEMAMHFDKMVRKHNVTKVLNQARQMYAGYLKQHTLAQQKNNPHLGDC